MTFFWQNPYPQNQIINGMARWPYVEWWASQQEERGRSFSGVDIYDAAPRTPSWAKAWARKLADRFVAENGGRSMAELYDTAIDLGYSGDAEQFGGELAAQAMGHGVSWVDDLSSEAARAGEAAIKIPRAEFYR